MGMGAKVDLVIECNEYFRNWILQEWQEHNKVDEVYQLRILDPKEIKFERNEVYFRIVQGDTEVGFVGFKTYEDKIYIYRFFIEPEYRNKGIGTEVLNKIIEYAKSKNKDIELDVVCRNRVIELYRRMGFKTHYTTMTLKINDNIFMN
jgi:ribosomal protein S18 acetylase RimI-like enzyme